MILFYKKNTKPRSVPVFSNAALAAAPKKVFLPCVSLPRANFYENIFYNAFALNLEVFCIARY